MEEEKEELVQRQLKEVDCMEGWRGGFDESWWDADEKSKGSPELIYKLPTHASISKNNLKRSKQYACHDIHISKDGDASGLAIGSCQ